MVKVAFLLGSTRTLPNKVLKRKKKNENENKNVLPGRRQDEKPFGGHKKGTGFQVLPEFTVVQHERDIAVLQNLKTYFQCGTVLRNHGDRQAYRVRGHEKLSKTIVPFFEKHKLKTKKRIDFEKFRDVVLLMEKGDHRTAEGLEKIRAIANTMNTKKSKKVGCGCP